MTLVHPQNGIHCGGHAEGTGAAHALFEVLNVKADGAAANTPVT